MIKKRDDMKDRKGQALVEFIMILPVFLILIMGIFDIGNIIFKKYKLQNELDVVKELYLNNKIDELNNYINNNNLKVSYDNVNDLTTIKIETSINIITPGLNQALKSPYTISEKATVINE